MTRRWMITMFAVACWSLAALPATAQDQTQQSSQSQTSQADKNASQSASSTPSEDRAGSTGSATSKNANERAAEILNTANQGEVDLGQYMQDHAQSQAVKDFAKMTVDDHQKAQDQLKDIAGKANLQLNTDQTMQQDEQSLKNRLQSAQGAQADSEYVRAEARDHAKVIRELRALRSRVSNPDLKKYIAQTMPALEKHLRQARRLERTSSSTASAKTPA